jgi:hypothetical protein
MTLPFLLSGPRRTPGPRKNRAGGLLPSRLSLFEKDPEKVEAAKARLEAKRATGRENYTINKEENNAKRRELHASKKAIQS